MCFKSVVIFGLCVGLTRATSSFTPPPGVIANAIDTQTATVGNIFPTLSTYETPIAVRIADIMDTANWNCVATYHPTALDGFTLQRPFLANSIPNTEHLTDNRIWCAVYAYAATAKGLFGKIAIDDVFNLFSLSISDLEVFISNATDCDDDFACYHALAASVNYRPDVVGVIIGTEAVRSRKDDGWNSEGNLTPFGECTANCRSYSDSIGFYDVRVKNNQKTKNQNENQKINWVNLLEDNGLGFFYRQEHVTPHIGFTVAPRVMSQNEFDQMGSIDNPKYNYNDEVDLVIDRLKTLATNETQKALVELMDNKFNVLVFSLLSYDQLFQWSFEERSLWIIGASAVIHDTIIKAWKEKVKFNLIRPTTVIQSQKYTLEFIETFGGPGEGVKTIRARDFQPYIRVMPHAEYPSGSGCICKGLADFFTAFNDERYPNTQVQGIPFVQPAGASSVEAGEPQQDIAIVFNSVDELYQTCGQSRLWGGMHFTNSVPASYDLCDGIGTKGYDFVLSLLDGSPL